MFPSEVRRGVTARAKASMVALSTSLILALMAGPRAVAADAGTQVRDQLEVLERALQAEPLASGDSVRAQRIRHRLGFLRQQLDDEVPADLERRLRLLDLRVRGLVRPEVTPRDLAIDATTAPVSSGSIEGLVRRSSDGGPLADVIVELFGSDGFYLYSETSDAAGAYAFLGLAPGTYYLSTTNTLGYVDELWNNFPCPGSNPNGCTIVSGTPLQVGTGALQANFELDLGSAIEGTVQDSDGLPLPGIRVTVWRGDLYTTSSYSAADGRYQVRGLTAGTYRVTAESFGTYLDELYDDRPCIGGGFIGCSPSDGEPVVVSASSNTTGVDFTLDRYGTIAGTVTDALTQLPIPWMNVALYDQDGLYVTSTYTDDHGRYLAGGLFAGTYFALTYDFDGFAPQLYDGLPCPGASCDPTTGTAIPVALNQAVEGVDFVLTGGCLSTSTALCLNQNRFRVETHWRTRRGEEGSGQALPLTTDTGYFWFFTDQNVEVFVKVIDACALPGFNNFWVFSGGMTDVEVSMTVTDTATGIDKVYTNDLGTPFAPIQDTAAFGFCP